ncbi:L,D-transpeptidase [Brevundimonas sp. LM2]|uniref:L,D-transpeptidase n=1 Tax=Brevundimonas sp. LM2 TaxID=1938605 RepID=UPI001C0B03C1|nr:L,D-transpeptidase [Brevundimonas sp. LM2]
MAASEVGQLKAWVLETADNQGLPFLVVDKKGARVLAFNAEGHVLGVSPILLGLARGDVSPPGIGDLPLSAIMPDQRVTPAGRFVASIGRNLGAKSILWIDYGLALSLHPVVTARAADRRLERLASATVDDNRISYGCINVPPEFFEGVIQPVFLNTVGVVYILPETQTLAETFFDPAGQSVTPPH